MQLIGLLEVVVWDSYWAGGSIAVLPMLQPLHWPGLVCTGFRSFVRITLTTTIMDNEQILFIVVNPFLEGYAVFETRLMAIYSTVVSLPTKILGVI